MADLFSVSVVIPLFNKEGALDHMLGSVLDQSHPADEVIIVDDGSTDGSVAAVERLLKSRNSPVPVRIARQRNQGVSAARNRGAEEARSAFIAFLDADDEWLPDYLAEARDLAGACPQAGFMSIRSARRLADGRLAPDPIALADDHFGIVENPLRTYRQGYGIFNSSSVVVRSDVWRRSGGFPVPSQKGEDIYCWLKLCMSEALAHSARPLAIIHDEHSGVSGRKGLVPHHFHYFLGTDDGRRQLGNRDLLQFLESNLLVQIGGHRLSDDPKVAMELRRLSKALPRTGRLKAIAASVVPIWSIRAAMRWRQRARRRAVRSA
jgi:glycosyltransferase involved in cell wall biosynthesis